MFGHSLSLEVFPAWISASPSHYPADFTAQGQASDIQCLTAPPAYTFTRSLLLPCASSIASSWAGEADYTSGPFCHIGDTSELCVFQSVPISRRLILYTPFGALTGWIYGLDSVMALQR